MKNYNCSNDLINNSTNCKEYSNINISNKNGNIPNQSISSSSKRSNIEKYIENKEISDLKLIKGKELPFNSRSGKLKFVISIILLHLNRLLYFNLKIVGHFLLKIIIKI